MITTLISTVVVLGILIFVHELGHFLVAKWMGVCVLRFSLGFGPKIVGITRGETEYRLSLVPLGGYVKMLGEESDEEVTPEQMERSFSTQPPLKRIAIVLAGPLMNFVLAILIFASIFAYKGIPESVSEIGTVNAGSPAEQAGLKAGDLVTSINGIPIRTWDDLSETVTRLGENPLTVQVKRDDQTLDVKVTPTVTEVKNPPFGDTVKRPIIGVTASGKSVIREVNPLAAGYHSLVETAKLSKTFLLVVVKLIQGVLPLNTLGGPILIAQMAGQQAREGLIYLINFMAIISVNLAVLNLLPIPVLDGGHIFFFSLEAILRRPIGMKKIEMAQKIGLVVLLLLMVVVFYNDIMRLIPGHKPDFMP